MRQENLKDIALRNLEQKQRDSQVRQERESELENPAQGEKKVRMGENSFNYTLPEGVTLIRYTPKDPPVPITLCSIVADVPKFIRHALGELDARLHSPIQIKAGDSVFELLSKLADCGLELRLEWPPESEPSKPSKPPEPQDVNAHGVDITDEDIGF